MARFGRVGSWLTGGLVFLVFGPPFLGVGLFACYRLGALAWSAADARGWVPAEARIESLELKADSDGEGVSYRVLCQYTYTYGGASHRGSRVGLDDGGPYEAQHHHEILKSKQAPGATVRCYVNPRDPRQAVLFRDPVWSTFIFWIPFAVCFTLVGAGVCAGSIYGLRSGRREAALRQAHPDEPWMLRADWAAGVVRSNTRPRLLKAWLFCTFWNAMAWPGAALFLPAVASGRVPWFVWFVALFPVVGLGLLQIALQETVRHVRYRSSELRLAAVPVPLGGDLMAKLLLPENPCAQLAVSAELQCLRQVRTGDSAEDRVSWRSTKLVIEPTGVDSSAALDFTSTAAPTCTRLSYAMRIAVPADCAPTASGGSIHWRLKVTGPGRRPGLDLEFDVPVFDGAE